MNQTPQEQLKPTITSIPYNERVNAHQERLGIIGNNQPSKQPISQPQAIAGLREPTPLPDFPGQGVPPVQGQVWMCGPKEAPPQQPTFVQPQNSVIENADPLRNLQDTRNIKHTLDELRTVLSQVNQQHMTQERVNAIGYLQNASLWLEQDINKMSAKSPQIG